MSFPERNDSALASYAQEEGAREVGAYRGTRRWGEVEHECVITHQRWMERVGVGVGEVAGLH